MRWRWWHTVTTALLAAVALLALWIALAYGGLPRLWSHHERRKLRSGDTLVSYTAQDIPGDPINLRLLGSERVIACAFRAAGWHRAAPVTLATSLAIARSVLFRRADLDAPVSPLYVADRAQTLAYQRDEGVSADRRHHVRLWRVGPDDWLAAASFDRRVGLSLYTLQITHRIGRDVDRERALVAAALARSGATAVAVQPNGLAPGRHRNGGGNRYLTDGRVLVLRLPATCPLASPARIR